jgi:hypothetical protein
VYVPHAVNTVVLLVLGVMVNTNVSVLQPVTEVYVPLVVYVVPFTDHVYESHALAVVVLFALGVIVNTKVSVLHPVTEVYVPLVV